MIIRPKRIFAFFTAIILAAGFHSHAFADDFYIGAGVYEVDSTISGFEDNDTVPAFFLGYTFIDSNFLMLAAELGKYDLGDYQNTSANADSDAYTLAAVVSLPVLSFIEIYAKAGAASVSLTVDGQNLDGTALDKQGLVSASGVVNDIVIESGAYLNVCTDNASKSLLLSGEISGEGTLHKTRDHQYQERLSTVTIAGANTYTGGTLVTSGTLTIDGSLADATMTITVTSVNGSVPAPAPATVDGIGTITFNTVVVEVGPGGVAGAAADLPIARPPTFAREANEVTALFQKVGEDGVLCREGTGMGAGLLNLPGITPGEQRRPTGAATRRGSEGMGEQHTGRGDAIEPWRADGGVAIGRGVGVRLIIGDDKENVRRIGSGGAVGDGRAKGKDHENGDVSGAGHHCSRH